MGEPNPGDPFRGKEKTAVKIMDVEEVSFMSDEGIVF